MEKFSCCSHWDECCITGSCVKEDAEFLKACTVAKKLSMGINSLYKGKLLLIDGNNLLYRSYYAYPHMSSPDGKPTSGIMGTLKTLEKLLREIQPSHLLFCFDASEITFRNELYPLYKANRSEAPEDIVPQFSLIRKVLDAFNIPYIEDKSVEADDLMGTIACKAAGYETIIVSSDKDLLQLVNQRVSVLLLKNGGHYHKITANNIVENMGYSPWEIPDLKALSGDKSDNIPGVPGVGEVTAIKLIREYGNIENVIKNAGNIPGKLGEKIVSASDEMVLFKLLATIKTDCDLSGLNQDRIKLNLEIVAGEMELQHLGIRSIRFSQKKIKDWEASAYEVPAEDIGNLFEENAEDKNEDKKAVIPKKFEQPTLF